MTDWPTILAWCKTSRVTGYKMLSMMILRIHGWSEEDEESCGRTAVGLLPLFRACITACAAWSAA